MTDLTHKTAEVMLQEIEKERGVVETAMKSMGAHFAQAADVHTYTPTLGKQCREIFYTLDAKYHFSDGAFKDKNPPVLAETIKEILAYANEDNTFSPKYNIAHITKVLSSIQGAGASIERETGLNVAELLLKTWTLAKQEGMYANAKELVLDNLQHNIAAGGGCLAGISGRLIQPYTAFVKKKLEDKFEELQTSLLWAATSSSSASYTRSARLSASRRKLESDSELELALALSLSAVQQTSPRDRALEEAIRLSRLQQKPSDKKENKENKEDRENRDLARALALSLATPERRPQISVPQPMPTPVAPVVFSPVSPPSTEVLMPAEKAQKIFNEALKLPSGLCSSTVKKINIELNNCSVSPVEFNEILQEFIKILKIEKGKGNKAVAAADCMHNANRFKYNPPSLGSAPGRP